MRRMWRHLLVGMIAGGMLLAVLPAAAQDAPPPAPTTPALDPAVILAEAQQARADADRTLDTINFTLAVIQVIGVLAVVFAGLAALAGFQSNRERQAELRERLQAADAKLGEVSTALKTVERLEGDYKLALETLQSLQDTLGSLDTSLRDRITEVEANSRRTNRTRSLLQLAQRQIDLGNFRSAMTILKDACDYDPEDRITRYFLGDLYVRQGILDEGIEQLELARQADYYFASAHASYAYAIRQKGDRVNDPAERQRLYQQAEDIFVKLRSEDSSLVDISGESVFGALAGLYVRLDRIDEAIGVYEHCRQITPYNSYPINNLGLLYFRFRERERDKARECFREVVEISQGKINQRPSDFWARFDQITAWVGLEESYEHIEPYLERALELVKSVDPMRKFCFGLENLRVATPPPSVIEPVIQRVQRQIARYDSGVS